MLPNSEMLPLTMPTTPPYSKTRYSPPTMNSTSTRWPANMLSVRRSVSVIGRTMTVDRNSIGASRM